MATRVIAPRNEHELEKLTMLFDPLILRIASAFLELAAWIYDEIPG